MSTTKKFLVPFDKENPEIDYNGFLYPDFNNIELSSFLEIGKDNKWTTGRVVYIGMPISKNDILEKIVNSGVETENTDTLLKDLDLYINEINRFKIGNIVEITMNESKFKLVQVPKPHSTNTRKMP